MKKLIILGVLTFANPLLASELTTNTVLGTDMATIHTKLTDMGYQVRKTEMEDGYIEVYVVKGNNKVEVYVSPETGKVTRLKMK